jgi:hypothetical protein
VREQLLAVGVEVPHRRHVIWLEHASMDDEHIVARGRELLDDRPSDEAGAA